MHASEILTSDHYAESVFATECNTPVQVYSLQRSRVFAHVLNQQLLWIPAADFPPSQHLSTYSPSMLRDCLRKDDTDDKNDYWPSMLGDADDKNDYEKAAGQRRGPQ